MYICVGGFAYRLAMHKLPIITKTLDKIAHVRKFNHISLSSLTLMAINSKQQAKVITKKHTQQQQPHQEQRLRNFYIM